MRKRSAFRDWAEYLLARVAIGLVGLLPRVAAYGVARALTKALDRLVPRLRRTALRNLELALPETSIVARQHIVDGVYRSIARILVAFAHFPRISRKNVDEWIRYDGREHFDRAIASGKGVLFATAHLGNWELSAFCHAILTAPMHVVVRPLDNSLIDAFVEQRRSLSGNRIIGKREYARSILKALHQTEAVGILIDQNVAAAEGIFVDFFGLAACAGDGFAKLAARSGAAVIPGFALWSEQEQKHILKFYPPLPMTGDASADTQTLYAHLEGVIREHPDQWLWIHRRWKTRPPGQSPLY